MSASQQFFAVFYFPNVPEWLSGKKPYGYFGSPRYYPHYVVLTLVLIGPWAAVRGLYPPNN